MQEILSDNKTQYPAITLCIKQPFIDDELKKFNITELQYKSPQLYYSGDLDYLYAIPYDDITLNLNDKNFRIDTQVNVLLSQYKFKGKVLKII